MRSRLTALALAILISAQAASLGSMDEAPTVRRSTLIFPGPLSEAVTTPEGILLVGADESGRAILVHLDRRLRLTGAEELGNWSISPEDARIVGGHLLIAGRFGRGPMGLTEGCVALVSLHPVRTTWAVAISSPWYDRCASAVPLGAGGYLGVCQIGSTGEGGVLLVRLAANGSVSWVRAVHLGASEFPAGAVPTPDGGALIVGTRSDERIRRDWPFFLKVNASGDVEWAGVVRVHRALVHGVVEVPGGYLVVGSRWVSKQNPFLLFLSEELEPVRAVEVETGEEGDFVAEDARYAETDRGPSIYVVGSVDYGWAAFVLRVDGGGDVRWLKVYGHGGCWARDVLPVGTRLLVVGGLRVTYPRSREFGLIVVADPDGNVAGCVSPENLSRFMVRTREPPILFLVKVNFTYSELRPGRLNVTWLSLGSREVDLEVEETCVTNPPRPKPRPTPPPPARVVLLADLLLALPAGVGAIYFARRALLIFLTLQEACAEVEGGAGREGASEDAEPGGAGGAPRRERSRPDGAPARRR
ncbi:MAG TPA: hypothetical protein ENF83_00520 [Candidatus Korarchaeota archaeon]|nr:hypothetical protein [Candidatus Korarchaeota archaeon]